MSCSKALIGFSVFLLTLAGVSVNSWLGLWMLLEFSFMFLMGIFAFEEGYGSSELMIKYYIVQVLASMIIMFSLLFSCFFHFFLIELSIWLGLSIKLGFSPFHFWVISVFGKLSWLGFYLVSTFSKLLPIVFLFYLSESFWTSFVLMLTVFVGSVAGIGNLAIQKLLGYSSMVGLGWLAGSASLGMSVFFFFFFGYSLILLFFVYLVSNMNVYYVNQFKFFSFSLFNSVLFFTGSVLFSGIPPFAGFFLKWWVSLNFLYFGNGLIMFFLVGLSLFSLIYYFSLYFYFMLLYFFCLKWYNYSFSLFNFSLCLFFLSFFLVFFI